MSPERPALKWFSPTYLLTHALLLQATLARGDAAGTAAAVRAPGPAPALRLPFVPAAGTVFAAPAAPRAAGLSPDEKRYLCLSIEDGVGRYMALRQQADRAADDFPRRFRTLYVEGQKARFRAARALDPQRYTGHWPDSRDAQAAQADLQALDSRIAQADAFFVRLDRARDYLYRAIRRIAPPAEHAALKRFVDARLDAQIDRARGPLSHGGIARAYEPDIQALRQALAAFRDTARRARQASAGPTVPPAVAAANRAIADINRFYAADANHIIGAPFAREIPNLPSLELLAQGVVTYCGATALDDVLRYGPRARQHSNRAVSTQWKYGPQLMVDADHYNRIPIKQLRFESRDANTRVPFARYVDIRLRGGSYQVGNGPWRRNPHPESDILEKAKYLNLVALIHKARARYDRIRATGAAHDTRDYTGYGWLQQLMARLGLSHSSGDEHGKG